MATWSTKLDSQRRILGEALDIPVTTFPALLDGVVTAHPDRVQYITPAGKKYTVRAFHSLSRSVAKALVALGVAPGQGAAILGANAVEWFAADVGASLAAVIPVGIYVTNKPDIVAYIVNHSDARVFFVDGKQALDKFLSVKDQCPNVARVVVWGEYDAASYTEHGDLVTDWKAFLASGADVADATVDERSKLATPQSVCKLIYTSGTTGPPKAVMVSHDNVCFTGLIGGKAFNASPADRMVSFLPASHIAANSTDIVGALANGIQITFADADALRGSLVDTLKKVRPTVLLAVPRVYEKIMERMLAVGAQSGAVKRAIGTWAKGIGSAASRARDAGDDLMPWGYFLASKLVFSKVKAALGLDECRLIVNAAAPLQKATDEYFKSLDFRIYDMYGMSEATGPVTFNYPDYRSGTSGKAVMGVEAKLHDVDEHGEGELCFRGRNMFVGYMGNEDETAKTMDADGFVHSGDLAKQDGDGFITITGRVKDLIVTAGGENVAPALVEQTLISAMPAVSRAFAIGDQQKFISAVMVPYIDEAGKLIGPAVAVNPACKTAADAAKDETWQKYLTDGVKKANEHALSSAAKVKKFELLTTDFSVETGELTPTMKVKRAIVVKKLEATINRLYDV